MTRRNILGYTLILFIIIGIVVCHYRMITLVNQTTISLIRRKNVIEEQNTDLKKENEYLKLKVNFLEKENINLLDEIKTKKILSKAKLIFVKFLEFSDSYGEYLAEKKNKLGINHSESVFVNVSAYTIGHTTSTGKPARVGYIAASKDLIEKWGYGSKIALYKIINNKTHIVGVYHLEDRMNDRYRKTLDIRMNDYIKALQWGRRKMYATKI